MDRYLNREDAGRVLAQALSDYAKLPNILVLALPRGGVPVAYEIALALKIPLDVYVVRKLGVPGHEELAMGAIAMDGSMVLNDGVIRDLRISPEAIKRVTQAEKMELERRVQLFRGNQPQPEIKNKIIILVDDGIATGATMRAAIAAIRKSQPEKIILAVPVAEKVTCEKMSELVDEMICPLKPVYFNAVGAWYENFEQTSSEEVCELLEKSCHWTRRSN